MKLSKIKDMVLIAVTATIICVSSWISVPSVVPFTMQTFGVFSALLILGGKRGTLAISLYIFMGAVGIPVFSGFQGGIGHLLGPTGGYIIGFIFIGIIYTAGENHTDSKGKVILLLSGLLLCYIIGTLRFMFASGNSKSFSAVAETCVIPYIIPDAAKLFLAKYVSDRLKISLF